MKNTVRVSIQVNNSQVRDELIARLSIEDYDAFEESENELSAFIAEDIFNAAALDKIFSIYPLEYKLTVIKDQNWNALWESNFQPVVVGDFCAIRAHFHPRFTDKQHEIIITPKMSFGTGHHATTYMMISEMSKFDFKNKHVADFGTGTGVLAILAEKLGSKLVWAIDNDDWSIENAKENVEKNNCQQVLIEKAEGFFPTIKFNIILANINRSIILQHIDGLLFGLNINGELLLSGLLREDEDDIVTAFKQRGLYHRSTVERDRWICIYLEKITV
jgi:ribosomal protein L11 methyltransferase